VLLPTDVEFSGKENPLATSPTFLRATCPRCGGEARRETDTMDTFVDSSWYFLRYASAPADAPFERAELDRWMPVDQYVGGIEHATMHLIYARYFTKVLHDLGLVGCDEPFARLFTQGMVTKEAWWCAAEKKWYTERGQLADDGGTHHGHAVERQVAKMSKSIGNVVAPEAICEQFGADTGRCYILFIGPPEAEAEWQDDGVTGIHRFLHRAWRLFVERARQAWLPDWPAVLATAGDEAQRAVRRKLHQTIEKVTGDIERFSFNTALAALMELVNTVGPFVERGLAGAADRAVYSEAAQAFALLLAPFAPHLADEIWAQTGAGESTYRASWPGFDPAVARRDKLTIVVQINGKVRDKLEVDADADEATIRALALASEKVQALVADKPVRKLVVVPGRLVSIVV
jgi:leucyl-tRNA synthetase